MENARQVIKEVADNVSQKSSSRKDEITVMKAMINDPDFKVDVYGKTGKEDEYFPAREVRKVVANVMAATAKLPGKEAQQLVDSYEFTKSDASAFVGLAKEFVGTYTKETGRKLPLGGRIDSNIELMWKQIPARKVEVPSSIGSKRSETFIPEHGGLKASNPCPPWVEK